MVECQPEGPFTLRPIAPEERDEFRLHPQRYHYLGFKRSVGESMGYAAFVGQELVALLDWDAAVLRCLPRDEHVGWDDRVRERNLSLVVGNRRFLVLPWIRIPHLASRILGANLRRLSSDWQAVYGHPVLLAETFVDLSRFKGTCYRAANWRYLGQTLGSTYTYRDGTRPRGCPKAVYVYPLARDAQRRLRSPGGRPMSVRAATEPSAEQLREIAAWIDAIRESVPEPVGALLDLHRGYLAGEEVDRVRRALKEAWRTACRALHLTPSSGKRRSSGSPLAAIPRQERVQAKSKREQIEARIGRVNELAAWHRSLESFFSAHAHS